MRFTHRGSRRALRPAAVLALLCGIPAGAQQAPPDYRAWGMEAVRRIDADYALPARGLYADTWKLGQTAPGQPAFMWGCGVQLSALSAAARLDPARHTAALRRFISGLDAYWMPDSAGLYGYAVLPGSNPPDRFYDDNIWMALALTEAYEDTRDPVVLERAEATFAFVRTGEDGKLGGGIYWHEQEKRSKNACSNASAAAASLRLYQVTGKAEYLTEGKKLYAWTNAKLQDTDGLFWDNIRLDGATEKTKWTYNTALMIRSGCLLYEITGEKRYLSEAERVAAAAEAHWVRPETGAIADGAAFAHMLSEAFLDLTAQDGNSHWRDVARRALEYVHSETVDSSGHYADAWSRPAVMPLNKAGLLTQASAARAFLMAAQPPESRRSSAAPHSPLFTGSPSPRSRRP